MDPAAKPNQDQGLSLSTTFWLVGSGFIVAATGSFVAYMRFHLPWWSVAVALGLLVGTIVIALEQFVARPLERLTRGLQAPLREGESPFPPAPGALAAPIEFRRLWRGLRVYQEQQSQARLARQAADGQVAMAQRQARVLMTAAKALAPEQQLAQLAPGLLRDLGNILGVSSVYLVPLRKHCPVPVLGPTGTPNWGDAVRGSGLAPWLDVLLEERPLALAFTSLAPAWAENWRRRTLWVVPLSYHGRAQGLLIAVPSGAERAFTRDELQLLEALAPLLAAGLHPPRWSEERKRRLEERRRELEAAFEASDADEDFGYEPRQDDQRRRGKRRRHKQGA